MKINFKIMLKTNANGFIKMDQKKTQLIYSITTMLYCFPSNNVSLQIWLQRS